MGWVHDSWQPQNRLALRMCSEHFNGALMSGAKRHFSQVFKACLKGQSGLVIGGCDALRALIHLVTDELFIRCTLYSPGNSLPLVGTEV